MTNHKVLSHNEWIDARKVLLAKEKEFTRLRDELTRQRQDLPWEKIEKGRQKLSASKHSLGQEGKQSGSDAIYIEAKPSYKAAAAETHTRCQG